MKIRRGKGLEVLNSALAASMKKLLRVLRSTVTENAAVDLPDGQWMSLERVHAEGGDKFIIELHWRGLRNED